MKLELYYSATSPYSRKVRVVLLEKGAEFGLVDVRSDARKAKDQNPLGKVPTLLVDDVPFFDSVVMTEYLDAVFPEPALLPREPYERALVRRYEALADGISDVLIPVVQDRGRPKDLQNAAMSELLRGKARACLSLLEQDVQGRAFLHGDAFSLADIAVVAALGYANLRLPELLEGYPKLHVYHQKQLERPSLAQTIPPDLPPL